MNVATKLKRMASMPAFPVLLALSASHCLNDLLQSVITAVYPMLKSDLGINFAQIGLITLIYQLAASIFQPVVGYAFDKRPFVYSLPAGMCCTTVGIILLAWSSSLAGVLVAVFMVGIGSATLHPEASRITSLAGHERRGFAQSVFQVGGNFGGSIGPLLVALIVAPHNRHYIMWFLVVAALCFVTMRPICRWYSGYLARMRADVARREAHAVLPLSRGLTIFTIVVIMLLIFSKYVYMASISSYYTFYLIDKFHVSVSESQIFLFIFVVSTAAGTLIGGPVGAPPAMKPEAMSVPRSNRALLSASSCVRVETYQAIRPPVTSGAFSSMGMNMPSAKASAGTPIVVSISASMAPQK